MFKIVTFLQLSKVRVTDFSEFTVIPVPPLLNKVLSIIFIKRNKRILWQSTLQERALNVTLDVQHNYFITCVLPLLLLE